MANGNTADTAPDVSGQHGPGGKSGILRLLLNLPPLLWLLLVLSAYSLVVVRPIQHPNPEAPARERAEYSRAEVPGVAELERLALPLLAALVATGIIRYLVLRTDRPFAGAEPGSPRPGQDIPNA